MGGGGGEGSGMGGERESWGKEKGEQCRDGGDGGPAWEWERVLHEVRP